ncbi:hypothetical protein [Desulfovulcanus sp.]
MPEQPASCWLLWSASICVGLRLKKQANNFTNTKNLNAIALSILSSGLELFSNDDYLLNWGKIFQQTRQQAGGSYGSQ